MVKCTSSTNKISACTIKHLFTREHHIPAKKTTRMDTLLKIKRRSWEFIGFLPEIMFLIKK